MTPQDKNKPVSITVKLHPEVLRTAKALGEFYNDSDVDHIVSEAVKDAAKDKKFSEWLAQHPNAGRAALQETKPRQRTRKNEAA